MAVSALNKAHLWVIGAGAFLAMRIYRTDPAIVLLASSIAGMAVYLISHRSTRTPSGTEGN
jgi:hypothetical protein